CTPATPSVPDLRTGTPLREERRSQGSDFRSGMASISSPLPVAWYPALAVLTVAVGLMLTASFFIYEATVSTRSRSLAKELTTAAVASVFLVSPLKC
uniref:Dolichyl-diphosphooligosaccharide-protein glycosyltransferase subunit OST5 n=1 Tax=Aegilops tauschii subsp. strangulata TaxID=200361 RepID=A0A453NST5_AEGTS